MFSFRMFALIYTDIWGEVEVRDETCERLFNQRISQKYCKYYSEEGLKEFLKQSTRRLDCKPLGVTGVVLRESDGNTDCTMQNRVFLSPKQLYMFPNCSLIKAQ